MTTPLAVRLPSGISAGAPSRFSSRRHLGFGFFTLAVLLAGAVGWGAFSTISGAVIATGQVDVETRDQVVEHIDGGTVAEIVVRDGTRVEAGDVLIRLNDAALRSQQALLRGEWVDLSARRNRLEAEFRGTDTIAWDVELAALAATDSSVRDVLDAERRLFEARHSSWAGQVAQLRERIGQTKKQIVGLEAQADAIARQRALIGRELDSQRSLFEKGFTDLRRMLELEREAARLDGQAGDIAARIAGARGRVAEIEIQVLQIGSRRVEEAEGQAREVQAREKQVREQLAEVGRRLSTLEVRTPVAGEVYGMRVFALGEVVRPGEPILRIVPQGAGLMVRAQLDPIHIDQVRGGQDAVLRFSAFSWHSTPEFEARVRRVSADTVRDERTRLDWYEVELEMGRAIREDPDTGIETWPGKAARTVAGWLPEDTRRWLVKLTGGEAGENEDGAQATTSGGDAAPAHAHDLPLAPGMPVEVYIQTEERTPLSYLVKPLTDYFSRSLREE